MTTPTIDRPINVEALERVFQFLNDHPDKHEQGLYISAGANPVVTEGEDFPCGTTACFAGWTGLLYAQELHLKPFADPYMGSDWFGVTSATPQGLRAVAIQYVQSRLDHNRFESAGLPAHIVAQWVLGLTPEDSKVLFSGINTRRMLGLMVKDLTNGEHLGDLVTYVTRAYDDHKEWGQDWVADRPASRTYDDASWIARWDDLIEQAS